MKRNALIVVSFILCLGIQAQNARIYVGPTAPRGSFKDFASPGWNAGAKVDFQLKKHLCLVTSLDLFYNQLTPYANNLSLTTPSISSLSKSWSVTQVTAPVCINVPLMVHAKFSANLSDRMKEKEVKDLDFWAEGAIGLNRRTLSQCSYAWTVTDAMGFTDNYSSTLTFDAKTTFAHQWGVGVTWHNRVSLGLIWYNLGRSRLTGSRTITRLTNGESTTNAFDNGPMREKLRTFRIGYTF